MRTGKMLRIVGMAGAVLLVLASGAGAAMIAPPADLGELAATSPVVVVAMAADQWSENGAYLPHTVTRFFTVERVWGIDPGGEILVSVPGGEMNGLAAVVPGAPHFVAGREYLLFLSPGGDGLWRVRMMAWGVLERVQAGGRSFFVPLPERNQLALAQQFPVEIPGVYRARPLLTALAAVARGAARWDPRNLMAPQDVAHALAPQAAPPACQFMEYNGTGIRWFSFETGGHASISASTPGQTGISDGGTGAVSAGAAAWTSDAGSAIDLRYAGTTPQSINCTGGGNDYQLGAVVFNDPCGDIPALSGCSGTLAYGGPLFSTATQQFDGTPWHPASALFVVVNDGAECLGEINFAEMITHELGHGLGFGHHNDPDATMYGQCCHYPRGAGLGATDSTCAAYLYPTQSQPQPPSAPTGLAANLGSPDRVDLSWTDTSDNEDGFRIYRSQGGAFSYVATTGPNTVSWSDTGVPACTNLSYQVRAFNGAGESAPSNTAGVQTPGDLPQAPGALTGQTPDPHTVRLVWQNGATAQDGVEVQRQSGIGPFSRLATLPGDATSYTDTTVTPGATYRYRLRSFNECGFSGFSNEVELTLPPVQPPLTVSFGWSPTQPWIGVTVRFTAQANLTGASFSWQLGDGATATGAVVDHVYSEAGTYTVRVTAQVQEQSATKASQVTVGSRPPLRTPRHVRRAVPATGP